MAAAIVLVDQLTKVWAVAALSDRSMTLIPDFLEFHLRRNPGAAFSSFVGGGQIIGVIAVGVSAALVVLIPRMESRLDSAALAFILGGAVGNLADRVFRGDGFLDGAVVDFIGLWKIPTFNVADVAINIGVALMFISAFILSRAASAPTSEQPIESDLHR